MSLLTVHLKTRLAKGSFEHRENFQHGRRTVSEEVEISGVPVHQPPGDQSGPAG